MNILIFNVENHHSTYFFKFKNCVVFFLINNALLNFRYQKSFSDIKTLDTWYAGICRIFWWQKSILYVQNIKENLKNISY